MKQIIKEIVKDIRLVAIDLDGTLLDAKSQVSQANSEALRLAQNKGLAICLATGKPFAAVWPLVKEFGLSSPQLVLNGGLVLSATGEETIYSHPLERVAVASLVKALKDIAIPFVVYQKKRSLAERRYDAIDHLREIGEPEPLYFPTEMLDEPVYKILTFTNQDQAELEAKLISLCPLGVIALRTSPFLFEFIPATCGKGVAIQALAKHLNLERHQIAAIGDSENDLSMLQEVGLPMAMGNANPKVKEMATIILADHNHSGVAEGLHSLLL